jgi:hypothetical protein
MEILSLCPLRCASLLWQSSAGPWTFTAVCKATYRLAPDVSPLHAEQEPPNEEDSYWDDDPNRSLSSPSDLVPFKARGDVLLVGNAFAPGGVGVRSLVVRMIVGEVDKSIEVFGKRAWAQDGQLREAPGFASMPLVYERAAGGPDTSNPVGVRRDAAPDAHGSVALPNLQPPGMMLDRRGMFVPPVGFGPIAPAWPVRSERLGRHWGSFSPGAWRERAVPEDLDTGYFNAAPRDQQVDAIRADERIVLQNLHPEHHRLVTSLPGVRPKVFAEKRGEAPEEVAMRCDTLSIDTRRGLCTLVWRGHVPLAGREQRGRVLVAMEERGQRVGWADVVRMAGGRGGGGVEPAVGGEEDVTGRVVAAFTPPEALMTMPVRSELVRREATPFPETADGRSGEGVGPAARNDDALPFAPARPGGGAAPPEVQRAAPVAPSSLVRAPVSSEPIAPPVVASPWAGGAPEAAGLAVGQIAPFSSAVPAPPIARSAVEGAASGGSRALAASGAGGPSGKEALQGALAASNAAAGASVRGQVKLAEAVPKPEAKPVRERPREMLELIWYDPAALPRIRRNLAWKKIISELKPRPSDDDFDGGLPAEQMKAAKDKRDVFGVLARGEVQDMEGIRRAMEMAIADDGSFVPPYVLTAGVLEFLFDEVETLKAMMVLVAPFVPGDKKLKETIDLVGEVLKTPGIERARGVAEGLLGKIREAFEQAGAGRGVPAGYLEGQVEAMLVEGRGYQKCTMKGEQGIRGVVVLGGTDKGVPVWVPGAAKDKVPIVRSFGARFIAEAHARGGLAFQVIAMAASSRYSL